MQGYDKITDIVLKEKKCILVNGFYRVLVSQARKIWRQGLAHQASKAWGDSLAHLAEETWKSGSTH